TTRLGGGPPEVIPRRLQIRWRKNPRGVTKAMNSRRLMPNTARPGRRPDRRAERGTEICACTLTLCKWQQPEPLLCSREWRPIEPRRESSLVSHSLRNRFGTVGNTGNLLRCIGRSRSAKNLRTPGFQTHLKGTRHDHLSGRVSQTFGAEVDESH